ncbi:Putative thioester hydrolase, partial [Paenibacillus sp. P22]
GTCIMAKNETLPAKPASLSYTIKASIVLPPDTNHHGTIFGGKLMAYIDDVATIAATRHARRPVVTASTDSVDFLHPVKKGDAVCLSAFVTWAHKTSMEIFVRVVTEDLLTGERKVCATSFLTFVALGDDGRPTEVAAVIPETVEEQRLHETAWERKEARKIRRQESKLFADVLGPEFSLRKTKEKLDENRSRPKLAAENTKAAPAETRRFAHELEAEAMTGVRETAPRMMEAYANAWGSEW